MAGLEIITFGCRLNAFESEVIRSHARAAGIADAVIFNTCAVTAEAESKARQAIRRARRERPNARIIVTGCAAQIDPARYAAMPEIDRVIGNAEKLKAESWAESLPRVLVGDIMSLTEASAHVVDRFTDRARAVLEVQQGCDHRCTFCVIPQGRGNSRSVPAGAVVELTRDLVVKGYREIVLTGVDLASYGVDLPGRPSLGALARRILDLVPELPRLRLSSLDPAAIDGELWRLIAEQSRFMPHLHLSLQSGDDLILKRMKRRHSRAQALDVCRRARDLRPGIALGADLIAGFPTEDESAFRHSLDFIDAAGLDYVHVFPYSTRERTPAARMPQLRGSVVKERASLLRDAARRALSRALRTRIGEIATVVVEGPGFGHSEHYAPVEFADGLARHGDLVNLRIIGATGARLIGAVL
ncbi:MAG TPA: tRNA (N(6)-L-threonylcarbamoyladenosine(37)-C(2))-methylthiotransferase MtaB [Stellaceae bacterium]|jgi:threonylcarbamoyladenosine tRNA methylthiotransferase MtaB|nr:tRNA (N(6)-L-threonylcarbamoyladenosine(37)-C(2))-methylthiotransferase MtaB [Stellaceae bacterium]